MNINPNSLFIRVLSSESLDQDRIIGPVLYLYQETKLLKRKCNSSPSSLPSLWVVALWRKSFWGRLELGGRGAICPAIQLKEEISNMILTRGMDNRTGKHQKASATSTAR
jgi:hypothetical protein